MDLDYNTEQALLQKSAKDFLKKECPKEVVRESRYAEAGYPEKLWKKMAKLGWMEVAIPEKYGGAGGDFADLAILIEAMGEACLPAPYFSTVVVAGAALLLSRNESLKKELLPEIASGALIFSYALIEPGNTYGFSNIQTTAVPDGNSYFLNGTKLFVEYAASSDFLIVVANVPGQGIGVFAVKADNPGIEMEMFDTLDYAKQCRVMLKNVSISDKYLLAVGQEAEELLSTLEEKASVAKCAEMLGGMQCALEMSVSHAKTREQFGRPIGSFQAIQHHLANMVIDVDCSRYITNLAAWKISEGLPATMEASMAKSYVSSAANRVIKLGHQVHGAISFCDEHDMHLFLRKCKAASIAFGDAEFHQEKVAEEIGL